MSAKRFQSTTQVEIEQQIGEIEGGQAIGASFRHVDGDVYVQATAAAQAPGEEHLALYLEQIAERTPPPPEASRALQRLWSQPFCAQVPGVTGVDLYRRAIEAFEKNRRLGANQRSVILADSGMGKTPSLLYLKQQRAKHSLVNYRRYLTRKAKNPEALLNRDTFVIPLLIPLRNLRSGLPFEVLVRDAFNASISAEAAVPDLTTEQVALLLQERTCLFLLDDLDELFSEHYKGGIQLLSQFMEAGAQQHQFIVTCRKSSYREQLGSLDELYLDDLTGEQVQEILGTQRYSGLHPTLRELVRNRALLKIVLELWDEGKLGTVGQVGNSQPVTRGQLLQRRNRQILYRRPEEVTEQELARLEMEEGLLERLAYAMQCDHMHSYSEREVMRVVRAYLEEWHERYGWRETVIALREKGLLERDEMRRWRFCDRATEAYFCAAAVYHDPAALEPILDQASDLWWRDVLEILVGVLDEPADLFFELIDRDALVAAHCIQSGVQAVGDRVTDALIDALIERMSQENSARRKYIVERIGASVHPRAPEALLRTLDREWSSMVVVAIVRALWRWDEERQVQRWLHRRPEGAIALFRHYDDLFSSSSPDRLIELLKNPDQPPRIRGISAILLGMVGSDQARETLLALLADREEDGFVAWCGVEALTQIDHPDVRDQALALYEASQGPACAQQRAQAVYLLGWMSGRPSTPRLLGLALQDPSPRVRGYAIGAMARLDLHRAREQIEALLATEHDPWVLRKAAETLGQIGTVDSIAVLEQHLRHERTRTRWMMRWAIAEIRQRHALS